MNLIALAIPGFFLLIAVELAVARLRGVEVYRFSDSIADLSCGVVQQVCGLVQKTFAIALYLFIYDQVRIADVPYTWWGWLIAFLGFDFAYYWFHRLSHEINIMWAAHVVHHQSEEYNLTVALRQSVLQGYFSMWFYLPLALIGVPPVMFGISAAVNLLYQFWIHTRLIGDMGWLEHVLNTPSHHRVHHGQNPKYIDKNHAGTLIIWDKLFGTFQKEEEEPVYGVTVPVSSWNVLWANTHVWVDSWHRYRLATTAGDRWRVWFGQPDYRPSHLPPKAPWSEFPKYDPRVGRPLIYYVLGQFITVVVATVMLLFAGKSMPALGAWALGVGIVLTCASLGALLDGRRWAFGAEVVRSLVVMVAILWLMPTETWLLPVAALVALAIWAAALGRIRPARVP